MLLCSYTADGGTQSAPQGGCYSKPACAGRVYWGCVWAADRTGEMLQSKLTYGQYGYNEVIVSAAAWDEQLPQLIEAIVTVGGDPRGHEAHRLFNAAHPQRQIPLVQFDGNHPEAFRRIA